MSSSYGRDLDLNLLRVFAVVAETTSVTLAAQRLYLTQPAVSAALRRLTTAVGGTLFVRRGRGLVLNARGQRLHAAVRPHLQALVEAALSPDVFDPRTSERSHRLGLADASEMSLLPALLRVLAREAPAMRVISVPVQFRTVGEALASGRVDAALGVFDDLPADIRRTRASWSTGFTCLYDPAHGRMGKRLDEATYFARDHVIVSYNGDLRGAVEDYLRRSRRVRCSVSSFANIGAIVSGGALLATLPVSVATQIRRAYPHLRTTALPFDVPGTDVELVWPAALDDDPAAAWLRARVTRLAASRH